MTTPTTTTRGRGITGSSFSRNPFAPSSSSSSSSSPPPPSQSSSYHAQGVKRGPNNAAFISSGIPDLDKILGGGFLLGSLVMIAEDAEAPHHLLLIRNFMSQGLVHRQPLLYASPSEDPKTFLGTLPNLLTDSSPTGHRRAAGARIDAEEQGLRIAWQYKKYFGEQIGGTSLDKGNVQEYCNEFDLRKPLDRQLLISGNIECISLLNCLNLDAVRHRCSTFLGQFPRVDRGIRLAGRIAIQSLCAPQCHYFDSDWDMLSFLRSLRAMLRSCNAVAVVTFPISVLSSPMSKRWQHLADTLLAVRAIPDEDKELAKLLTGYQDMVGLLHVNKIAQINTQVPVILEATTFSLKLQKRRSLILERLNQAPVDSSSENSSETSGSCSGSLKATAIDF